MAINYTDYKTGEYPFPKHEIDPKKKNRQWHLEFVQAMFAAYMRDKTSLPYSILNEYAMLRAYGAGKQDPEIYQDLLLGENDDQAGDSATREGWLNINWDIFSVAPKFKSVVLGMMENQEHDLVATAVDPTSGKEREEMKWRMWFDAVNKDELAYINNNLGIQTRDTAFGPTTIEELSLFEELGGFKLKKEYAIERGLDYTFYISDWPEIKRKIENDFMDINIGACRDYVDKYTQKVRTRYVDPAKLIIQYSRHNNHKNSEWAGEIIPMKIVDIRSIMSQEPKQNQMTEVELRELAYQYNGINMNPSISNWETDDLKKEDGSYRYDDFWIDVIDAEIKSVDIRYKQYRKNARGETYYQDDNWGKVRDTDTRKTKIVRTKTIHRVKWIIGTDCVFDWGYQFDIPRPGKKEVALSYHCYKLTGRSMVSLMQPNLDQIQLTWLKMQNAIAQAAPSGIAVEYSSLQNMTLGGGKMAPLEVLEIRRGQGDLVYRATTHRGYVAGPHSGKPVQELEGGIGRSLGEFVQIFEMNFNFIRDLTGINQIADASSPDPNQSVTGSQMAVAATNNALRPLYSGYLTLKEYTGRNIALRIQLVVKHNKRSYNAYYPVLGKSTLQALKIGEEVVDADFSFKLEGRPTDEMKQATLTAATEAMRPDKDGFVGLEYQDFLFIQRLLEQGNLKLAQALLSYRSKANKQHQLQLQRENMQIDNDNANKTLQIKGEEERKNKNTDNELKKDFETHKTNEAIRLKDREHTHKMAEIAAEKNIDAEIEAMNQQQAGNDNQNSTNKKSE